MLFQIKLNIWLMMKRIFAAINIYIRMNFCYYNIEMKSTRSLKEINCYNYMMIVSVIQRPKFKELNLYYTLRW